MKRMADSNEEAVRRARADLASRLGLSEKEIGEASVEEADFPDTALGAAVGGEMSGMMITSGQRIRLAARGQTSPSLSLSLVDRLGRPGEQHARMTFYLL